jgi:hypothetical protein
MTEGGVMKKQAVWAALGLVLWAVMGATVYAQADQVLNVTVPFKFFVG